MSAVIERPSTEAELKTVPISHITPFVLNPRKTFDEGAVDELADNIRQFGVLQPLVLRARPFRQGRQEYDIVCGYRRYLAAKRAGLDTVPAVIRAFTNGETLAASIIENMLREDLTAIEEARGIEELLDMGVRQTDLARRLGCSQPRIANRRRLLALPPEIQCMIEERRLSAATALALLSRRPDGEFDLASAAEFVTRNGLSQHDVEAGLPAEAWHPRDKEGTPRLPLSRTKMRQGAMLAVIRCARLAVDSHDEPGAWLPQLQSALRELDELREV